MSSLAIMNPRKNKIGNKSKLEAGAESCLLFCFVFSIKFKSLLTCWDSADLVMHIIRWGYVVCLFVSVSFSYSIWKTVRGSFLPGWIWIGPVHRNRCVARPVRVDFGRLTRDFSSNRLLGVPPCDWKVPALHVPRFSAESDHDGGVRLLSRQPHPLIKTQTFYISDTLKQRMDSSWQNSVFQKVYQM